jgi:GntR family transcriptional regulator
VPGEQDLTTEFGVSRITAKRALNELADAGLVVRERGRGTRVVNASAGPCRHLLHRGLAGKHLPDGPVDDRRRCSFSYVPASEDIAQALEVEPGTEVQRAVRVRASTASRCPIWSPMCRPTSVATTAREDLNVQPLLHLLERAGVDVASARQTISATLADDRRRPCCRSRRLAADRGAPCRRDRSRARRSNTSASSTGRISTALKCPCAGSRESGPRWTTTTSPPVPAGGG